MNWPWDFDEEIRKIKQFRKELVKSGLIKGNVKFSHKHSQKSIKKKV